jgi:hypothetical protein
MIGSECQEVTDPRYHATPHRGTGLRRVTCTGVDPETIDHHVRERH